MHILIHLYSYIRIYITVINCAIEESTVGSRKKNILPHDKFICDHIKKEDILVVSVGGNDIALKPSFLTIINMLVLLSCTTNSCLENCTGGRPFPFNSCCGMYFLYMNVWIY
jgi:hypothetical protein